MELHCSHTFNHPQHKVWEALMNPEIIGHALPGVEELIAVEGEALAWKANAKIGIAAVNGRYAGTIRMSEINAPDQYRLTVSGEGQQSIINGTALIKLVYDADKQQTILTWDAEAHINGNLARVGQRLIKSAADMMSRRFFDGIDSQIPPEPAET
jgi:uncharacterized protein